MMYKSPITLIEESIVKDIVKKQEGYVVECVRKVGVDVDKEELVKALACDRGQYEKGYADGKADAVKHGHWVVIADEVFSDKYKCSECGKEPLIADCGFQLTPYCPFCGAKMN